MRSVTHSRVEPLAANLGNFRAREMLAATLGDVRRVNLFIYLGIEDAVLPLLGLFFFSFLFVRGVISGPRTDQGDLLKPHRCSISNAA